MLKRETIERDFAILRNYFYITKKAGIEWTNKNSHIPTL